MSEPRIVTQVEGWFLNSRSTGHGDDAVNREYQVDYRWAICYSLLNFICASRGTTEQAAEADSSTALFEANDGKGVLENLRRALTNKEYWVMQHFLEVIPFEEGQNGDHVNGYVAIDKADGMYPLVLYSSSRRDTAYRQALDDVIRLYGDHVYPCLCKAKSITDWSEEFQTTEIAKIPWNYAPEVSSLTGNCPTLN